MGGAGIRGCVPYHAMIQFGFVWTFGCEAIMSSFEHHKGKKSATVCLSAVLVLKFVRVRTGVDVVSSSTDVCQIMCVCV